MEIGAILFLVAAFLLERFFQKKFPRFYAKIQFPANIVLSILVAVYCGFFLSAAYDVLISEVSGGDKAIFAILMVGAAFILAAMAILTWKQWLNERKSSNPPS